jgi:hypothetical protein
MTKERSKTANLELIRYLTMERKNQILPSLEMKVQSFKLIARAIGKLETSD